MERRVFVDLLARILACIFLASAVGSVVADEALDERHPAWGMSPEFGLAVAFAQLSAAILLALRGYRFAGALLGGVIMVSSAGFVVMEGEFARALGPLTVSVLCVLVGLDAVDWEAEEG